MTHMTREEELAAIDAAIDAGRLHRITPSEAAEAALRPIRVARVGAFNVALTPEDRKHIARRAHERSTIARRAQALRASGL